VYIPYINESNTTQQMSNAPNLRIPNEMVDNIFRNLIQNSDQRSLFAIQNWTNVSRQHVLRAHESDAIKLMKSMKAYLETGPVENASTMAEDSPCIPMYELIRRKAFRELFSHVKQYRTNPIVIIRTLSVFTASFDLPTDIPHMPMYIDNIHLPEKSVLNTKACVSMIQLGFFDFVAGVMHDFDRNRSVVSACIPFFYSVTAVMNIVSEQIVPYCAILKAISSQYDVNTEVSNKPMTISWMAGLEN